MNAGTATRRAVALAALILAAGWLMGLGGGTEGGGEGSRVPIPDKNFTATVTDLSGNSLAAERFTWEGKVYLRAQYGNATVTLPFGKISGVTLLRDGETVSNEMVRARVSLRSGETIEVQLDKTTKLYGETKFGSYEIFLKDVDSIRFG